MSSWFDVFVGSSFLNVLYSCIAITHLAWFLSTRERLRPPTVARKQPMAGGASVLQMPHGEYLCHCGATPSACSAVLRWQSTPLASQGRQTWCAGKPIQRHFHPAAFRAFRTQLPRSPALCWSDTSASYSTSPIHSFCSKAAIDHHPHQLTHTSVNWCSPMASSWRRLNSSCSSSISRHLHSGLWLYIKYLLISACLRERSHICMFIYITCILLLHVLILAVCCQLRDSLGLIALNKLISKDVL